MAVLRVATRSSELALRQTRQVCELLKRISPAAGAPDPMPELELLPLVTSGDRLSAAGASRRRIRAEGGKALFIKELERALLDGEADFAVHSLKDVPAVLTDDLELVAVLSRADAHDALISPVADSLAALPPDARVGVGGRRRRYQLDAAFPRLQCVDVRGNVETRLEKLDRGECEALILAAAGLERLDCSERIRERLPLEHFLPAPGQGALAVEACSDTPWRKWLDALNDPSGAAVAAVERILCQALGADCDTPLGALARPDPAGGLHLQALLCGGGGRAPLRAEARGEYGGEATLGLQVAGLLHAQGAEELLAELRRETSGNGAA